MVHRRFTRMLLGLMGISSREKLDRPGQTTICGHHGSKRSAVLHNRSGISIQQDLPETVNRILGTWLKGNKNFNDCYVIQSVSQTVCSFSHFLTTQMVFILHFESTLLYRALSHPHPTNNSPCDLFSPHSINLNSKPSMGPASIFTCF